MIKTINADIYRIDSFQEETELIFVRDALEWSCIGKGVGLGGPYGPFQLWFYLIPMIVWL